MLTDYIPLLFMLVAVVGLVGFILIASALVFRKQATKGKDETYECGMTPIGDARKPFGVRFYVTAVLFILFDIEAVFLIPWALNLRNLGENMGWLMFAEMLVFLAILGLGLAYVWRKGGLDWKK